MAKSRKPKFSKEIGILNARELNQQMEKLKDKAELAEKRLLSDFSKRIPSMVATEVTARYSINRQQVTGKMHKSAKKPPKKVVGTTYIRGDTIGSAYIQYVGHPLSISNFWMSPTIPPQGRSYTLRASILKGKKFTLGKVRKLTKREYRQRKRGVRRSKLSPVMLVKASHAKKAGASSSYIPVQRRSTRRDDLHTAKTVSLPQMVDNKEVRSRLDPAVDRFVKERLEHHMKRLGVQ